MKIAFITFEFPPVILGGAGTYASNVTRELAKSGHDVSVFTPLFGTNKPMEETGNLKIYRIPLPGKIPFKALQFWLKLPQTIKNVEVDSPFDIIHFNGISYWFVKKVSKAPHVITIHHLVNDAKKSVKPNILSQALEISGEKGPLLPIIERRCIEHVDMILAVSYYTKERIVKTYGISSNKISVVPEGINPDKINFTEEELNEIKMKFNLPDKPIILFVGRVDDPRKGLFFLLKAFKKLTERIEAVLIIVGSGNQKEPKRKAKLLGLETKVFFTGFVDECTLKKIYSICDIYVVPSRLEGFGLTILDAMVAGRPIVATKVGAIPEIIGDYGILVDPENEAMLSNAIAETLNINKNKSNQQFSDRANEFTWRETARKTVDVYNELT